jgi:hypothetical protein
MIGSFAPNFHEGSRSEILADYLFSAWGTVTPVRRQDDYGVDLHCTLAERLEQRAFVRDYFVVQVKSDASPWVFDHPESVRWLVEHPTPLFLACIDKKSGVLSVYHVIPRFLVWVLSPLPEHLELRPEDRAEGGIVAWEHGQSFSLSAPVLKVTLQDLMDNELLRRLRDVFTYWVHLDRENCDLVRFGLLRFRMPPHYRTNELPNSGIGEMGNAVPDEVFLRKGIRTAAEAAECIGGQLARRGDREAALFAGLLVDYLYTHFPDAFAGEAR